MDTLISEKQLDTYGYDPAGRLTELREQAGGQTAQSQCFTYDNRNRLTKALTTTAASSTGSTASDFMGTAPYQTEYSYDRLGNLQSVTDTDAAGRTTGRDHLYPGYDDDGTWTTANADQPHGVRRTDTTVDGTAASADAFTYDVDGTMLTRTESGAGTTGERSTTYTWTPLARLAAVRTTGPSGSQLTHYAYDADGALLVRTTPGETVAYLGGTELTTIDGTAVTATRYYTCGTSVVAMRTTDSGTGKVVHLMADSQASTQLTVDAATGTATRRRCTPFGDERSGSLPAGTDHGFLGKTEDASTGLSLLGARAYDPRLGRFLSPDPLSAPSDPQNLSAYSYSNNDPVNYSDPTGLYLDDGTGHSMQPEGPQRKGAGIPAGGTGEDGCYYTCGDSSSSAVGSSGSPVSGSGGGFLGFFRNIDVREAASEAAGIAAGVVTGVMCEGALAAAAPRDGVGIRNGQGSRAVEGGVRSLNPPAQEPCWFPVLPHSTCLTLWSSGSPCSSSPARVTDAANSRRTSVRLSA